jgi:hypothetical protein
MMINKTLNQGGSIRLLCSCMLCHSTGGISVLKVCNTSDSLHHYLGAALFDMISCTSYLSFNWVVQQFEG